MEVVAARAADARPAASWHLSRSASCAAGHGMGAQDVKDWAVLEPLAVAWGMGSVRGSQAERP